ncbi:MAG: Mov34/MPN/PAD-1 family protein [bacterium]|nr:Mov34/MPN/PAD-1 family protein [bacterium]
MFPVHLKAPGTEMPPDDIHYVIARNGIFLRKKNSWIDAVVRVKQIAILDPQETSAHILLPPIPALVMGEVIAFFQEVYREYTSEAAVLLHFSERLGWAFSVPEQHASAAHVSYNARERLEGYQCMGTMHSHGYLEAYHSPTDQNDESEFDGIHITVGRLSHEKSSFTLDMEAVVNGNRFKQDPLRLLEGVEIQEEMQKGFLASFDVSAPSRSVAYHVVCPELEGFTVPKEWMDRIHVHHAKPQRILHENKKKDMNDAFNHMGE